MNKVKMKTEIGLGRRKEATLEPRESHDEVMIQIKSNIIKDRKNKINFIIYPENKMKGIWDLVVGLILIITCSVQPVHLAFYEDLQFGAWTVADRIFDGMFAIDLILNFFSAFYDDEYVIQDSKNVIVLTYLKTWFIIDFVAIIPFWAFEADITT